jgi:hypothetical protein
MSYRYPRVQPKGFWKHETNSYANELANQEAEDRACIRYIGGRLWELKGDELLDALLEEKNNLSERLGDEEYDKYREEVAQQAAVEARTIPFSDVYHIWMVSIMERIPLWQVAESADAFFVMIEGFDTQREFQYLLDIFQDAINENRVTKRPQIDRTIEWIREQLQHLARQSDAPSPSALPADKQLEWLGTKVELVELAYALLEAGTIRASSRAKAVALLASFFGVSDLGKPEKGLEAIKKRREQDGQPRTPLLDKLKESLIRYLSRRQL